MQLKLGKRPFVPDSQDLHFRTYLRTEQLPAAPLNFGHEYILDSGDWSMFGNGPDSEVSVGFEGCGDCVFAGAAHETLLWTAESGVMAVFSGKDVVADYSAVTGYDSANPATDSGTDVRTALKYRKDVGIVDAFGERHKIDAFVSLTPGNLAELRSALWLFGAIGIGINLPQSAMDQVNSGEPWTVVPNSPSLGGHYVPLVGQRDGMLECVTWGQLQKLSLDFYTTYCDEAWAILSTEMLSNGRSLEGFDLAQLQQDLAQLR